MILLFEDEFLEFLSSPDINSKSKISIFLSKAVILVMRESKFEENTRRDTKNEI